MARTVIRVHVGPESFIGGIRSSYGLCSERVGAKTTVLDDVTDEQIDARHVDRRVDDWEKRVRSLYVTIGEWLPDGWNSCEGASVCMHEEMMRRFGVKARQIPTLVLTNGLGESALLESCGLWIIGRNGRVDMKCGGRHYLIVDMADSFEARDWQAASAEKRVDRVLVHAEFGCHRLVRQAVCAAQDHAAAIGDRARDPAASSLTLKIRPLFIAPEPGPPSAGQYHEPSERPPKSNSDGQYIVLATSVPGD